MLAKLWKKVLLAICIIACIFNIMSKLVNRHSLKENLESANDGEIVFSIFQKEKVMESDAEEIIEGVKVPEVSEEVTNEVSNTTIIVEKVDNTEGDGIEQTNTETTEENIEETENVEEKNNSTFKFSDFTVLFEKNT